MQQKQWRSPTAELLFKNHPFHTARSAGTSSKARIKINQKMIENADIIFLMERKHQQILKKLFPTTITQKQIIVLDIEDNYQFNDPGLVEILRLSLKDYL